MTATDGTTVDASVIPEHGAPTRVAILSGFTEGWYELIHANGRADRVMWDAGSHNGKGLTEDAFDNATKVILNQDFVSGLTQPAKLLDYFPYLAPPPES